MFKFENFLVWRNAYIESLPIYRVCVYLHVDAFKSVSHYPVLSLGKFAISTLILISNQTILYRESSSKLSCLIHNHIDSFRHNNKFSGIASYAPISKYLTSICETSIPHNGKRILKVQSNPVFNWDCGAVGKYCKSATILIYCISNPSS